MGLVLWELLPRTSSYPLMNLEMRPFSTLKRIGAGLRRTNIYLGVFLVIQSISICIQAYCYEKVSWLDDPVAEAAADADDKGADC